MKRFELPLVAMILHLQQQSTTALGESKELLSELKRNDPFVSSNRRKVVLLLLLLVIT